MHVRFAHIVRCFCTVFRCTCVSSSIHIAGIMARVSDILTFIISVMVLSIASSCKCVLQELSDCTGEGVRLYVKVLSEDKTTCKDSGFDFYDVKVLKVFKNDVEGLEIERGDIVTVKTNVFTSCGTMLSLDTKYILFASPTGEVQTMEEVDEEEDAREDENDQVRSGSLGFLISELANLRGPPSSTHTGHGNGEGNGLRGTRRKRICKNIGEGKEEQGFSKWINICEREEGQDLFKRVRTTTLCGFIQGQCRGGEHWAHGDVPSQTRQQRINIQEGGGH
jgi:hypothetical protein